MMNLEQLKAMQEAINSEIAKQEATLKPWPQVGDECWHLAPDGIVCSGTWGDSVVELMAMAQGSIFQTKEGAITERCARRVVTELHNQPGYRKFVIDTDNYSLSVDLKRNVVYTNVEWRDSDGGWRSIYFTSREAAQAAVIAVGEDRICKAAHWWAMGEV